MKRRIVCIIKPDRFSSHDAITHYGYIDESVTINDSPATVVERKNMVSWAKQSGNFAYVRDSVKPIITIPCEVKDNGHTEFLETKPDSRGTDNLLRLRTCQLGK